MLRKLAPIVFISFFIVRFSFAAVASPYPNFDKEIKNLADKYGVKLSDVGARITLGEAENLVIVLDHDSKTPMIPASVTKIATASAVLANFQPGSKFVTRLLSDSRVKGGTLQGNLFLKGAGDPSFVSENMWFLVNAFLRNKISKIEGDLVVDDSLFDKVRYDSSRQDRRVDRAYDAPVGAMSFNWNSVNVFVRPSAKGEVAKVFVDPENDYIRLNNRTKTIAGNSNNLIVDRGVDKKFDGDLVTVSGGIGSGNKEIVVFKNITQPDLWSGYNLKSFLIQRGIQVTGKVRNGNTPETARVLAESESKAIEHVLADMNKFSNNYVSEMLTKNMAALKKTPASLADGMKMINEHLISLGIDEKQFNLKSPSGLSNENKMSALALWSVLQHLHNDFQVQPEFLTSLPIAGVDGTLKKRMKNTAAERWVRAKTGYVNNVVSLAGYAGRKDGKVLTFALIYNGSTDEAKVRSFFDHLLIYLVQ